MTDYSVYFILLILSSILLRLARIGYARVRGGGIMSVNRGLTMLILHILGFIAFGLLLYTFLGMEDKMTVTDCILTSFTIYICVNTLIGIYLRQKLKRKIIKKIQTACINYCRECGYPMAGEYDFCVRCGAKFKTANPVDTVSADNAE